MKKIILILFLSLFFYQSSFSQSGWIQLNSPTTIDLRTVYFTSPETGYIGGGYPGIILFTSNGGANWLTQNIPTTEQIASIVFIDNNTGFAAGGNNSAIILKTTNRGTNWNMQTFGSNRLYGLSFPNNQTGYSAGVANNVLKTTDSGNNWFSIAPSGYLWWSGVYFMNVTTGFIYGQNGSIYKTTNGGTGWFSTYTGTSIWFSSVSFLNINTGFATGNLNTLLWYSTDSGNNWSTESVGSQGYLNQVYFFNSNIGYIGCDNGTAYKTTNSGSNWNAQNTGITNPLAQVYFTDVNTGYIVCNGGAILKTTTGGDPLPPQPPAPPVLISPPNGAINQPTTIRFIWSKSQYAASYRFQLALDSLFINLIVNDSTISDSTLLVVNLLNNTTYWWRVNAKNSAGTSPYSAIWHFRTILAVPSPPTLISPTNGATGQSLTPTLVWSVVQGAVSYKAQVSNDSLFSSTLLDSANIPITQVVVPAGRLLNNHRYYWRVNATNAAGTSPWSVVFHFSTLLIGMNQIGYDIPKEYKLFTNYPNPFNPTTKIKFNIRPPLPPLLSKEGTGVVLTIFDISGREVATLVNEELQPGTYEVEFNGNNYASGIYFYKLQTENFTASRKMLLIK